MQNRLSRLHRDEDAQVSFLAIAAALCFVGLLAMVINTNDMVRKRMRMQEIADVTALSAATWNSRGLNLVSMVNVLNSKLLTMTVLVNSLNQTLPIVKQIAVAQGASFKACSGVPVVGAFCAVMATVVQVQEKIIRGMEQVIKNIAKHTKCGALVWKVMDGLQSAANGIRSTFPALAVGSAVQIAESNGATFGIAINGGAITGGSPLEQAMNLPVTDKGYKTRDFCNAMKAGGPGYVLQGYDNNQGPARLGKFIWDMAFIPFFNLLPHPIFYGFYSYYMAQIGCTPDAQSEENKVETDFYDLPTCRKYNSTATWQRLESRTGWVSNGGWGTDDFVAWQSLNEGQGDGPDDEDMDKFGELPKYGEGIPDPDSGPPLSHGPGYLALESESKIDTQEIPCNAGDSSSGYPANAGGFLSFGCLLDPDDCVLLRDHPEYTLYSGKHVREPGGLDAERTGVYYMRTDRESKIFEDDDGDPVTRYRYTVDVWVLAEAGSEELEGDALNEYVLSQGGDNSNPGDGNDSSNSKSCKNRIQPLLLDEDENPDNRMRYIALVYAELGTPTNPLPFWSRFFDSPPDRITAYAQAQSYNKLSEDMFTQDWRARLEYSTLLEDAISSGDEFDLQGSGDIIVDMINSANNH